MGPPLRGSGADDPDCVSAWNIARRSTTSHALIGIRRPSAASLNDQLKTEVSRFGRTCGKAGRSAVTFGKDIHMALARMTAESRSLLTRLVREPAEHPDTGLIPDLTRLGFIERRDSKWYATRAGKDYLKTHR